MTKPDLKVITLLGAKYKVCSVCEHSPRFCQCDGRTRRIDTERGSFTVCGLCYHSPKHCECYEPVSIDTANKKQIDQQRIDLENANQRIADLEWEKKVLERRIKELRK